MVPAGSGFEVLSAKPAAVGTEVFPLPALLVVEGVSGPESASFEFG